MALDLSPIGVQDPMQAVMGNAQTLQGLQGERQQILDAKKTARQQFMGELDQVRAEKPKMPEFQEPGEFKPSRQVMDNFGMASSIFLALALLGGAGTRRPMTTAMNSFAGFMKGWASGNQALWDREYKQYKLNLDAAMQKNQQMLARYQATMDDHKLSLQQKMDEWNMTAAEYQDDLGEQAIRSGDAKFFMDMNFKRADAMQRAQQAAAQIGATYAGLAESRRYHDQQLAIQQSRANEKKGILVTDEQGRLVNVDPNTGQPIADLGKYKLAGKSSAGPIGGNLVISGFNLTDNQANRILDSENRRTYQELKPISEFEENLGKLANVIQNPSTMDKNLAQQVLANLQAIKGARNTNLLFGKAGEFGDVVDRAIQWSKGMVLGGEMTDVNRQHLQDLVTGLQNAPAMAREKIIADAVLRARARGVNANNDMLASTNPWSGVTYSVTGSTNVEQYRGMSPEEIVRAIPDDAEAEAVLRELYPDQFSD